MGRSKKKDSASGSSYSSKISPSDNYASKGEAEDLGKGRREKEYKISTILDDWKKIVGFYIACIAVFSTFNIAIWSLLSSDFNIEVSAYLLSHGMGGGAISFQPIVIMQVIIALVPIAGLWLMNTWNNRKKFVYDSHGNEAEKIEIRGQSWYCALAAIAFIVLVCLCCGVFQNTFHVFNFDTNSWNFSPIPLWTLICSIPIALGIIFAISVTIADDMQIRESVENAQENPKNTILGSFIVSVIIFLVSIIPSSLMYQHGYGIECLEVSKSSVSDRVLGSIPENNLTDGQRNKIRESLEESWSVRGEEGERFSIFVTREDKDTIDGVLFKKGDEDLRSKGKIVTINRKAIKTRDVCHQ
jgi:membrane protein